MDLSTSNSKDRLPPKPFLRMWVGCVLVTCLAIGLFESLARVAGFPAMPADDWGLWAIERTQVRNDDPNQVVFLGSSRMQVGLDPDAFASGFQTESALQLAILGGAPIPILKDLADNTAFQGIAVCDFFPAGYFMKNPGQTRTLPESYAARYQGRALWSLFERRLKMTIEESFSSVNTNFHPVHTVRKWWREDEFPPQWLRLQANRAWKVNYEEWRPEWFIYQVPDELKPIPMDEEEWRDAARGIEEIVGKIQSRGGEVVFVHFPIAKDYLKLEGERFPREKFWNPWSRQTSSTTIHYEDYPQLAHFSPPDGSHLGSDDSVVFGRDLGTLVRALVPERRQRQD